MCVRDPARLPRRERGFSVVEVMVGMVIALIIGLVASGSAKIFTASQRQGVGVGAMNINSASAIAAMKGDITSAGLGFFGNSNFLCYKLDLGVGTTATYDGANFSPVLVTAGGSSDQLDVVYSSNIDGGANVLLNNSSDGTSATLMSLLPANVGDAVLMAPATAGNPCLVRSVTAVTSVSATVANQILSFDNTGSYNQASFSTAPTFAQADSIALLGKLNWSRYHVDGTDLKLDHPLDGTTAILLHNVLAFRVQYGASADSATGTLAGWQYATGGTYAAVNGDTLNRVRALRIGIVTRSPQREKEDAYGNCVASASKPTLPWDSTVVVQPDVTDWQCYRYRSSVVIVPLRNLVW